MPVAWDDFEAVDEPKSSPNWDEFEPVRDDQIDPKFLELPAPGESNLTNEPELKAPRPILFPPDSALPVDFGELARRSHEGVARKFFGPSPSERELQVGGGEPSTSDVLNQASMLLMGGGVIKDIPAVVLGGKMLYEQIVSLPPQYSELKDAVKAGDSVRARKAAVDLGFNAAMVAAVPLAIKAGQAHEFTPQYSKAIEEAATTRAGVTPQRQLGIRVPRGEMELEPELVNAALKEAQTSILPPGQEPALLQLRRALAPPEVVQAESARLAERVTGGGEAPYGKTSYQREAEAPSTERKQITNEGEPNAIQPETAQPVRGVRPRNEAEQAGSEVPAKESGAETSVGGGEARQEGKPEVLLTPEPISKAADELGLTAKPEQAPAIQIPKDLDKLSPEEQAMYAELKKSASVELTDRRVGSETEGLTIHPKVSATKAEVTEMWNKAREGYTPPEIQRTRAIEELQAAVKVGDEVVTGGKTHPEVILGRGDAATIEAASKPENQGFELNGKFLSREEASKLIGEQEPLTSERLNQLRENQPEPTTEQPRDIVATLESLKISENDAALLAGGEQLHGGLNLPHPEQLKAIGAAAWNKALDIIIAAIKSGRSAKEALDAAMQHIRFNSSGKFDEAKVRANLLHRVEQETRPGEVNPIIADANPVDKPVPGQLKESAPSSVPVVRELQKLQQQTRKWFRATDPKNMIVAWFNATNTKANIYARSAANDLSDQLNRTMGRKRSQTIDDRALRFVVESGGDIGELRKFLDTMQSERANPKVIKLATEAITRALENWDRLDAMREAYSKATDAQVKIENSNGLPTDYRKNYVPSPTERPSDYDLIYPRSKGQGAGRGFMKGRVYENTAEQIAGGETPFDLGAISSLQRRMAAGMRTVNRKQYFNALKGVLDSDGNPVITEMISHSAKLPDGTTKHWESAPKGYTEFKNGIDTVAVKDGFSGLMDALTGRSKFENSPISLAVLKAAYAAKHVGVLVDLYHFFKISMIGMSQHALPRYKNGLWLIDYTPEHLARLVKDGEIPAEALPQILERKKISGLMASEGYNVGRIRDQMYADWFQKLPLFGHYNRFLFDQYQRGIMAHVGVNEFYRYKKMFPELSDSEVARKSAYDLNITFRNLMKQSWVKSETFRDLSSVFFFAPQWFEGGVRSELGAYRGAVELAANAAFRKRLVASSMLKGAGTLFAAAFVGNQIVNYISRKQPTWENEEENHKMDGYMPDYLGSSEGFFLSPMDTSAEITHQVMRQAEKRDAYWKGISDVLQYKLSAPGKFTMEFLSQKDWKGNPVDGLNQVIMDSFPTPIGSGAAARAMTGQQEAFPGERQKQIMSSLGVKAESAAAPFPAMVRKGNITSRYQFEGWMNMVADKARNMPSEKRLEYILKRIDEDGVDPRLIKEAQRKLIMKVTR